MEAVKTPAVTPAAQQPPASADPVYKHLRPESTNAQFLAKLAKSRKLAQHNAATKPAALKIKESEKAQDTPVAESQSLSNRVQVDDLHSHKVEAKSATNSKLALDEGIRNSVPPLDFL